MATVPEAKELPELEVWLENAEEVASDVASLGFDLPQLVEAQKLAIDYVRVERSEIEETGEYDLEGLFVRLDYAIQSTGAKRVVLDTIELIQNVEEDRIAAFVVVAIPRYEVHVFEHDDRGPVAARGRAIRRAGGSW